jgi:hypothetical protein
VGVEDEHAGLSYGLSFAFFNSIFGGSGRIEQTAMDVACTMHHAKHLQHISLNPEENEVPVELASKVDGPKPDESVMPEAPRFSERRHPA